MMNTKDSEMFESYERESSKNKIFYAAAFCNVLINLDHGIIPAATKEIKIDLDISEAELGMMGSVVYAGFLLGSAFSGYIFQKLNTKLVVVSVITLYIMALLIFPITKMIYVLALSRFLVGFFQVFLVVYFPVWVDLHGEENKTLWITYLQLGVTIGVFLGYSLSSIMINIGFHWKTAFYTQILMLVPVLCSFMIFKENALTTMFDEKSEHRRRSRSSHNQRSEDGILSNLKILWKSKLFVCCVFSLSSLFFVLTGIQFWISDYLRVVLEIPQQSVFLAFAFVSITGPTLGVLIGGYVLNLYGGYTGKYSLNFCLFFGSMAFVTGIPIPFLDNFFLVILLLWVMLFFGGSLMPAVTGMMISSVPKHLRALGNSTSQLAQNLIGFLPSPFLYGFVCRLTGGEQSRWGMILLVFWSVWGIVGVSFAKFYYKCDKDLQGHEKEEQKAEHQNITQEIEIISEEKSNVQLEDKNIDIQDPSINEVSKIQNNKKKQRSFSHNFNSKGEDMFMQHHFNEPHVPRRMMGSVPWKIGGSTFDGMEARKKHLLEDYSHASPVLKKRKTLSRKASQTIQNITLITSMNSIPFNDSGSSSGSDNEERR